MGSFAIIERSPGGLNGYTIQVGRDVKIWTPGGINGVVAALAEEVGANDKAAGKLEMVIRRALILGGGKFALVALPEPRKAKKAVR